MSVVVVIPSRGRPQAARLAVQCIRDTAVLVSTRVVLAVDRNDPELDAYRALRWPGDYAAEVALVVLDDDETGDLVKATNTVSMRIAHEDPDAIIGNLGDDHLARTPGWDRMIANTLMSPGIAYGDDKLQGEDLPTAPFISAEIVNALGYYALPDLSHLFIDNVWRDLGAQSGTLHYLPGIVIEHMHPLAGKAEWDEAYVRVNSDRAVRTDRLHYESWRKHAMAHDVERVRLALPVSDAA